MHEYSANLVEIVSPEIYDLEIDLGFGLCVNKTIRLMSFTAPNPYNKVEEDWVNNAIHLISQMLIKDIDIRLTTFPPLGNYAEYRVDLFYDTLHRSNILLSKELINLGYGVYWNGKDEEPKPWFVHGYPLPREHRHILL